MNISCIHPQPGHTQLHPGLHLLFLLPTTGGAEHHPLTPAGRCLKELGQIQQDRSYKNSNEVFEYNLDVALTSVDPYEVDDGGC